MKAILQGHNLTGEYLLPFATEMAGDFLVTDTKNGEVYILRHDTNQNPLRRINSSIQNFFAMLKPERDMKIEP